MFEICRRPEFTSDDPSFRHGGGQPRPAKSSRPTAQYQCLSLIDVRHADFVAVSGRRKTRLAMILTIGSATPFSRVAAGGCEGFPAVDSVSLNATRCCALQCAIHLRLFSPDFKEVFLKYSVSS